MGAVDTPYMKVRNALAPCRTLADLSHAWASSQATLRTMDQGQRAALVAMKDFYKGMIQRGEIHEYLKARETAASRKWTGTEIQEPPDTHGPRMAVPSGRRKAGNRR